MDDQFENIDDKFSEIDAKLQSIEDLINVRLEICFKKVSDIYSLQHKVNETNKMNNQSILHQINQYDEEPEHVENNKFDNVFNSLETSASPNKNNSVLNNKCFIKHQDMKTQDKDMFYMSSAKNDFYSKDKTDNLSKTSSKHEILNNEILNNENNSVNKKNLFTNLYKKKLVNNQGNLKIVKDNISFENDSNLEELINSLPKNVVDNFFNYANTQHNNKSNNSKSSSVILEMGSDVVKPCEIPLITPKFANAMKMLNETNIIKNNSYNRLNEKKTNITNEQSSSNNSSPTDKSNKTDTEHNIFIFTEVLGKNKNKIIELN
jgi:hypothetical protein